MADRPKPRERSGYSREETQLVESACLTVAVGLGELLDRLCIVGGLVPVLLVDRQADNDEQYAEESHPGTNDLDVALTVALLDDGEYAEIGQRLKQEGFGPDKNDEGNPTPQRWKLGQLDVTIDFLLPELPDGPDGGRVQPLAGDFGAFITPGLEVAFDERIEITLRGVTLKAEKVERQIPVCGPGAFTVLKALAFDGRGENKDAFDLVYVLRRWPDGAADVAERIAGHADRHSAVIQKALTILARDFADPDTIGPMRAVDFQGDVVADRDAALADAYGYVDDLLRQCSRRGLSLAV